MRDRNHHKPGTIPEGEGTWQQQRLLLIDIRQAGPNCDAAAMTS
jgi:hypothetical protein